MKRILFPALLVLSLGCESETTAPPDTKQVGSTIAKLRDFVLDSFHLKIETQRNSVIDYEFRDNYLTFTRDLAASSDPWGEALGELRYWRYAFTIDSGTGSLSLKADFAIPQHEGTVAVKWKEFTYDSVAKTISADIVDIEPLLGKHIHVARDHGVTGPGEQGWIYTYLGSVDAQTNVGAQVKMYLK